MEPRLKICLIIIGLAMGLSGCESMVEKVKSDFDAINQNGAQERARIRGEAKTGGVAMAAQPEAGQSKPAQIIIPKDKRTATAIDEALPMVKKVLAIHQCVKDWQSLRLMNIYAVPGTDMSAVGYAGYNYPNYSSFMRYHDRNKCVSVSTLDQWTMPALNALQFRAVYFADDSGETVNFLYLFKKMDDGSWKIAQFRQS